MKTTNNVYLQAFEMLSEFEKKVNPFQLFYKDFPVWLGLRVNLYLQIVRNINPGTISDLNNVSLRPRQILRYTFLLFKKMRFLKRIPLFNINKMKNKYLLFGYESDRKEYVNNKSFNIYIDPMRIIDKDGKIIGIEIITDFLIEEKISFFYALKAIDLFLIQGVSYLFERLTIPIVKKFIRLDNLALNQIISNLNKLGIEKKVFLRLLYNFIIYFEFLSRYWRILFKLAKPKLVAGTEWYSRSFMIMHFIANKMNIPTIEMMHGMIRSYHPGYGFKYLPDNQKLKYTFPNYLIVFGKYFKDILVKEGTFWSEDKILALGYPWLDYYLNDIKVNKNELINKLNFKENVKILTITSQYDVQPILKNMLLGLDIPKDWMVIVKLHPFETFTYKNLVKEFKNKPKVKFVTEREISLYQLLKISTSHASFTSTVLLEAPFFGVSNYIIDYSLTKGTVKEIETFGLAKVSSIQNIFYDDFKPKKESLDYIFSNLDGTSAVKILDFFKKVSEN